MKTFRVQKRSKEAGRKLIGVDRAAWKLYGRQAHRNKGHNFDTSTVRTAKMGMDVDDGYNHTQTLNGHHRPVNEK